MTVHRVPPPNVDELIRLADEGDKRALVTLYGHASAWVRSGKPIPEPLGTWIGARLLDVAHAIDARSTGDIGRQAGMANGGAREMAPALAVALKVQRAGKSGRTPRARTADRGRSLAGDVLHFMEWEGLTHSQACNRAVEYDQQKLGGRIGASVKTYEAAWHKYGTELLQARGLVYEAQRKQKSPQESTD